MYTRGRYMTLGTTAGFSGFNSAFIKFWNQMFAEGKWHDRLYSTTGKDEELGETLWGQRRRIVEVSPYDGFWVLPSKKTEIHGLLKPLFWHEAAANYLCMDLARTVGLRVPDVEVGLLPEPITYGEKNEWAISAWSYSPVLHPIEIKTLYSVVDTEEGGFLSKKEGEKMSLPTPEEEVAARIGLGQTLAFDDFVTQEALHAGNMILCKSEVLSPGKPHFAYPASYTRAFPWLAGYSNPKQCTCNTRAYNCGILPDWAAAIETAERIGALTDPQIRDSIDKTVAALPIFKTGDKYNRNAEATFKALKNGRAAFPLRVTQASKMHPQLLSNFGEYKTQKLG